MYIFTKRLIFGHDDSFFTLSLKSQTKPSHLRLLFVSKMLDKGKKIDLNTRKK